MGTFAGDTKNTITCTGQPPIVDLAGTELLGIPYVRGQGEFHLSIHVCDRVPATLQGSAVILGPTACAPTITADTTTTPSVQAGTLALNGDKLEILINWQNTTESGGRTSTCQVAERGTLTRQK